MNNVYRRRRLVAALITGLILLIVGLTTQYNDTQKVTTSIQTPSNSQLAVETLEDIEIKGRAPKTGYEREMFGSGWQQFGECDTRNNILLRDLRDEMVRDCKVQSGVLDDPYTGKTIVFKRGPETSDDVQIDHVVALSDAWQKGAQLLSSEVREQLANDPLELLAVDGKTNEDKGDGDAATWLPPNKSYRCRYVARQIAVKQKYALWVTRAEYDAMKRILATCPSQVLPVSK